jgi:large-conductance mechanosensitive channel
LTNGRGRFVEEIVEGLLIDLAVAVIGIVFGRLLKKLGVLPS